MRAPYATAFALSLCAAAAGCEGASADNGLNARLRVNNAQFVPGALEADPGASGPIAMASPSVVKLYPGVQNIPLAGSVAGGTSVLLGFAGDAGHWIVPAPLIDSSSPPENPLYTFSTRMSLSPGTPLGMETLIVRGVDAAGTIGPSQQNDITVAAPLPSGAMVITLEWDTNADLDLHAVVPVDPKVTLPPGVEAKDSVEVWAKAPLALPPSPTGYPSGDPAVLGAGRLDFDSNSNCLIDGRRQENIVFANPPPAGRYIVRVDAFSMCGQASAQWKVTVTTPDGAVVNPATWQAIDADTRGVHGIGAGRLAVDFTL
jgi:hypothetical protein